jgi:hypothetical protein
MAGSLTAIEFSEDACLLVRVRTRGTSIEVLRVEQLDPVVFPEPDAFVAALRDVRKSGRFPRRTRVVLWNLPDGASADDPRVAPRLEPLIDAGFTIERVVSPCNALAVLARIRVPKPESATIWLAVNSGGVAIVATRPGELLYSHAFAWDSSVGAIGSQARLLQRYSLVSYLAPEARQAIAAVREAGSSIDAIVICGTLPELRSLTMPLIEELDVEVETLDSLSGLIVEPSVRERLLDLAPAIRLACAGALARPSRPRRPAEPHRDWPRIAALFALLVLIGSIAALLGPRWLRSPTPPSSADHVTASATSPGAPSNPTITPAPAPRPAPPPAPAVQPVQAPTAGRAAAPAAPKPAPKTVSHPPLNVRRPRADTSQSGPLRDPIPHVTTILVAPDRRFAMVDGRIVGVGDRVGQRTVTAIEPRVVVFREPSGVEIRVGLGGRLAANRES